MPNEDEPDAGPQERQVQKRLAAVQKHIHEHMAEMREDLHRGRHGRGRGPRGQRPRLSQDEVARAALAIVDRDGLDAFSMRKLGAALGVDPMAVYYYFPNKAAVLDGIADAVYAEITPPPADTDVPWEMRLRQMMRGYRDALRAHPHALPVLATHPPSTPTMLRQVEAALAMLCDIGLPAVGAFHVLTNLGAHVVGIVLAEVGVQPGGVPDPAEAEVMALIERTSPEKYPTLMAVFRDGPTFDLAREFDAAFELGLDLFITGIAARLAQIGRGGAATAMSASPVPAAADAPPATSHARARRGSPPPRARSLRGRRRSP